MKELKVKSGKGALILRKSKNLVGLKNPQEKDFSKKEYVKSQVFKNLGGFNVVNLERSGRSIDEKLDEVRTKDEVEVGTHVYYAYGSAKPLVPTGEIYIIFNEGVSEEEQDLALDEYCLILVERREANRLIAAVTKDSPNPIKVASWLQSTSLVKLAIDAKHIFDLFSDCYLITSLLSIDKGQIYSENGRFS